MFYSSEVVLQKQEITRHFPKNILENDIIYFKSMIRGQANKTTIKKIKNVHINNELLIKEKFMIVILTESFGDTWQEKVYNRPLYQIKNYIKNILRKKIKIKEAIWCFDQFSTGGYYHWVTEICPRLWIANEYINSSIPLLVPQYFFEKWNFSDSFFKPFNREIITFKEDEVVDVENLTFISQTGGPFNFQPLSIHSSTQYLKNYYLKTAINYTENYQKIYISRNKSGKRTLLNENEILPILNKHGFKVIYAEELPIEEQIQLFSRTTHLLSIHGAGLSNLVFMQPKSKVIEIRHQEQNHVLNCFYTLAHTFDMEYYYVFGNNKGNTLPNENRPEDKSIYVNIEMLENVLNCI
jgi:hypothetical protein